MKPPILFSGLMLSCACGTGPASEQNAGTAIGDSVAHATIDLAGHGLPLLLTAPDKELTGGADPSIIWKDETGTLAVGAGEHFELEIREEPADIPRLKATLDRDLLRRNTIVREEPDLLVWRSEFPDDPSLVFIHFYRVLKTDGREFTVQDADGPPFNEQDIERMRTAISAKPPA